MTAAAASSRGLADAPLMFDLFCGMGGATEGFLPLGWRCIGIDIEEHVYGEERYPAELWLRDVLGLHGSDLREAHFIWASPPCQFFSYTAMPWSRAKALAAEVRADPERLAKELALFNACFRIQKEASIAAGRHIPMVVENVRGAIPWVGRSRWNFGSFHLWGDVPALMPAAFRWFNIGSPGQKVVANNPDGRLVHQRNGAPHTKHLTNPAEHNGVKLGGSWFHGCRPGVQGPRNHGSNSNGRKAASAMVAKIPAHLSRHIGMVYWPGDAV